MKDLEQVYLYPMSAKDKIETEHPYINGVCHAMSGNFKIVNYGVKSKYGVFDLLRYKYDIIYLNWIEDIGSGKLGLIQLIFTMMYISILKFRGKIIVWTHHNVHSHIGPNFYNKIMNLFLIRFSTKIIIHTLESKNHIPRKHWKKLNFFFHPTTTNLKNAEIKNKNPKYDILIWGSLRRSKGVDVFLKFLKEKKMIEQFNIHIIGKIKDDKLRDELNEYSVYKNIVIEDRFINDSELYGLHKNAKIVFFSYTGGSVLNSGVVLRSLQFGANIVGPYKGAFIDLFHKGLICTYNKFDDLLDIFVKIRIVDVKKINDFCENHTWENFGKFLYNKISKKNEK